MELRHFRIFTVLAEELHFGRAAHRLNTVQPVISKTLRDIETEVGTGLIEQSSRKATLTPAGRAFLASAQTALHHADVAVRAARSSTLDGVESLRLGLTIGAAQPRVGKLVAAFKQANPVATVEILEVDETTLGQALSHETVDAVIAWDQSVPSGLSSHFIDEVPMSMLLPTGHPLSERTSLGLTNIEGLEIVLPSRAKQPVLFETYKTYCVSHDIELIVAAEAATTADLLALVAGGIGIGHAPVPMGMTYPGIVIIPQRPSFSLRFNLVWSRSSPVVEELVAAAKRMGAEKQAK